MANLGCVINCVHAQKNYILIACSVLGLDGRKRLLIISHTLGSSEPCGCGLRAHPSGLAHRVNAFTAFVQQGLILRRQGCILRLLTSVLPHLAVLALLRIMSAVLVLLLIHHLLLDKLGMAPLSPHPLWWL